MSTHVKLIDFTQDVEPFLLGHPVEELLRGLPVISATPAKQPPSTPTDNPPTPTQYREMLSFINPTFDGGNGTWVGIGKAILHGQLPVIGEIDWKEMLYAWCSGDFWRERTGDETFVVPTYQGQEELFSRLKDAPRATGPVIGLGTIIKLAREGGYVGSVGIVPFVASETSSDGPEVMNEIQRLLLLSPIAYSRERKAVASKLGCSVTALDETVKKARGSDDSPVGQGRALELPDPEPWPELVSGVELLDALAKALRRYVVMDQELCDSVAIWVVAAYCYDNFIVFPRLAVLSPEKQCGKTTLLDVLTVLVPRPLPAANVSAAVVFRIVEMKRPTLLVDEADTFLKDNEELRGVLNSGHRRGGNVLRCVGDDAEPRGFSTWAPAVIAAIGRLGDTLEDRSVLVSLRRRRKDEAVDRLRLDRTDDLCILARKAARWAADAAPLMGSADPAMPEELFNRAADNWRPLLAVADAVGGDWPQRARKAAMAAAQAKEVGGDQSVGVLLLGDLKLMFEGDGNNAMFSEAIVTHLVGMEDRPWAEFSYGKPISKTQLAKLLNPFGVKPGTVRCGGQTGKGYKAKALADVFLRYLPDQAVTPSQPAENDVIW